jgi:hypothetical protein
MTASANGNGKHRCDAKNRRGEHCGNWGTHYSQRSGKWTCRMHGANGGGPRGPRNGKWKHGATDLSHKRRVIAFNEEERRLRESFIAEGYKIIEQLADAKLVSRRALGYALESGDMKIALEALRTVAQVAESAKRIAEGALVRVVLDEAVIAVFAEKVIEILSARLPDGGVIALIAHDLGEVDWSKIALPSVSETAAAASEKP